LQKAFSDTYAPAEDTFFLAGHIEKECGRSALDVGTGSGYLAKVLEGGFELVVGTDISFAALSRQEDRISNAVCCKGSDALRGGFDLAVCNLPYLPSDDISDSTVDGGPGGLHVPLMMLKSAARCLRNGGKMLFLTSSLANYATLMAHVESLGFSVSIVAKKRLFFEELIIVEAVRR